MDWLTFLIIVALVIIVIALAIVVVVLRLLAKALSRDFDHLEFLDE